MEVLQGPGIQNIFRDKRTGKTYATPEALLASYGIGASRQFRKEKLMPFFNLSELSEKERKKRERK